MRFQPIKSEQDYQTSLKRLEDIFDAAPDTKEGDEAETLSLLIDNYEKHYYPIDAADPIEALRIRKEE